MYNYIYHEGESVKSATWSNQLSNKKPSRNTIDGPDVPFPQVWSSFIALEENKADLARILSEAIMHKGVDLPARFELVTGGGFPNPTVQLQGNHEEADKWFFIHFRLSVKAVEGCLSSPVIQVWCCPSYTLCQAWVWTISGATRKKKCYPIHRVSIRGNLLGCHALTWCSTLYLCFQWSWQEAMLGNFP